MRVALLALVGACAAQETALERTLLVVTRAYAERLSVTRRYERWFGGVAYLIFPPGAGPATSLDARACEFHRVGCFFSKKGRGGEKRNAAYVQLFAELDRAFRGGGGMPAWLARAWRGAAARPAGAIVCHMDFWLQPPFFEAAVAAGALPADRPWTLASGLNRAQDATTQDFRVFGRYCLAGDALDENADWNWGGRHADLKNRARAAVSAATGASPGAARVCASWADFFYAPGAVWAPLAAALDGPLGETTHEVAVATAFDVAHRRREAPAPAPLDCWGCSLAQARDIDVVARHGCGHRIDLKLAHVRDGYRALLDGLPFSRNGDLEDDLAALDAAAGAPEGGAGPYWRNASRTLDRWTSGCCRLKDSSLDQTACTCVANDPPTDTRAARRFPSPCGAKDVVSAALGARPGPS